MNAPRPTHRYAAIGLSPADRAQLALLFEQGLDDGWRYVPSLEPGAASFLVINADDRHALDDLRGLDPAPCVLLIGHTHWGTGWPVVPRPISGERLAIAMRQLAPLLPAPAPAFLLSDPGELSPSPPPSTSPDSLPVSDAEAKAAFAVTSPSPSLPPEMVDSLIASRTAMLSHIGALPAASQNHSRPPSQRDTAATPLGPSTHASSDAGLPSGAEGWPPPAPAPVAQQPDSTPDAGRVDAPMRSPAAGLTAPKLSAQVLIVAEFGIRSHTLPKGLRALGYLVDTANGSSEARAMLPQQPYRVVFLDQASLGRDIWSLASTLVNSPALNGQAPQVAIVARKQGPLDRWRAHRMGCAWMNVPLDRDRLTMFLARRGVKPQRGLHERD